MNHSVAVWAHGPEVANRLRGADSYAFTQGNDVMDMN